MMRLDKALVQRGLCSSRTLAQKAIEQGRVRLRSIGYSDAVIVTKASLNVETHDSLEVNTTEQDQYVSRGALKIIDALNLCRIDCSGLVCLDIGQSTGGFTEVLLERGALGVLGIEVGHDQLHSKLQKNKQVLCLEGLNARHLNPTQLRQAIVSLKLEPEKWCPDQGFDLIVADLSFISLLKVTPTLKAFLNNESTALCLVKPQFEVGPQAVGKKGIVPENAIGTDFERYIINSLTEQGFTVKAFFPSPIKGGDGNKEFFVWICPARS